METCSIVETSSSRCIAPVKWFNSKAGYGFLIVTSGPLAGTDVFVHHSGIHVSNEQYKYLVQGEYVEYTLEKTKGGKHEYQAVNVCGINNGKLMCETRKDFKQTRSTYQETKQAVNVSGINNSKLMCETRKEIKQTRSTYQETNQATTPPVEQQEKHVDPSWSLVKKNRRRSMI